MTFAELAAIEDPMQLMSTGFVAPMLIRYVVLTGQLESRYPNSVLPVLLDKMNNAALKIDWDSNGVGQKAPLGVRDTVVDNYLDALNKYMN